MNTVFAMGSVGWELLISSVAGEVQPGSDRHVGDWMTIMLAKH